MSNTSPKVSVIIPTYNSAQFIAETLESVFAQTYKDYEIIVVDDGSTDNTREVLQPYMSRIKYIYKENGGPASARNVGIKNARGEFIAFLDADDLWLPEKLEKQVEYFKENPEVGLVFSDCIRLNENGMEQRRNSKIKLTDNDMFMKIWWHGLIATLTVIVRKICFDKVGIFDESKEVEGAEDYDLWLRIAKEYQVSYLDNPLAKYRVRATGHNRSNIERAYNATREVIKKHLDYLNQTQKDIYKLHKKRLFNSYFSQGISFFTINEFHKARHSFKTALTYKLLSPKSIIYYLSTFFSINQIDFIRRMRKIINH